MRPAPTVPAAMRAPRPAGRNSQTLDEQVRDYWGGLAYVCQLCGGPIPTHTTRNDPHRWTKDHILPLAYGGGNDLANLQPAHHTCNVRRHTGQPRKPTPRALNTSRDW